MVSRLTGATVAAAMLILLWQPLFVFACAITGAQAYQAAPGEVALAMERAALSQLGSPYPSLPPLEKGYPTAAPVAAPVPCVLIKAIGYVEGSWRQASGAVKEGTTGPVKESPSCGYGIMQITSGMRRTGELPEDTQRQIAADYRFNIAWGAKVLAEKWNAMDYLNAVVGERDPSVAEQWYYAVWAYNQFNFRNNPNNPDYAWPRPAFDGTQSSLGYPYQELVFGYAAHPPAPGGRPLWDASPLALPRREDIGQTPGPIPAPTDRHSGACPSLWADTNGISWRLTKGQPPMPQTLSLTSTLGPGPVQWTASASAPWLQVRPGSGNMLPVQVAVSVDAQAVPPGVSRATVVFTTNTGLTPITLPVEVVAEDPNPFKRFLPYLPRRALGTGR